MPNQCGVTLTNHAGKVVAEQESEPFGFLTRPLPMILPGKIERTAVSPGGLLLVNGKPVFFRPFPLSKTDLVSVSRMLHFPKTHKLLPLPFPKEMVFKPGEDAFWKQTVQERVRANKSDGKLFG